MKNIVSIDFLYCSYEYTCVRHVESLLNYYKCKYMAIVNVQQWKTSCKHWNLLTDHQKIGWPWYDWVEFINTGFLAVCTLAQ